MKFTCFLGKFQMLDKEMDTIFAMELQNHVPMNQYRNENVQSFDKKLYMDSIGLPLYGIRLITRIRFNTGDSINQIFHRCIVFFP